PVRAVRVGYVGELGYELHVPTEYAPALYETVRAAGAAWSIADTGYRAIETCRLEKGYVYWSSEIGPDYDPLSAGLENTIDLTKDFIGRDALAKIQSEGSKRILCSFTVEGFAPFLGGETIVRDGRVVGQTASCGFGHTVGKTIAFGWLPGNISAETAFEIHAYDKSYAATRVARTIYDPDNARLLA
ncbi:MAG TPA: glycine cleavage T C-terminal barrel domain-containing protein, partial [Hyphomicrobium zavarzinii]|nr:glycine cleavage T C-terminal barrel domain-containing protein [Hyphomicrobium zavarzinii]